MNDLPVTDMPPNVAHLCQTDDGNDTPSDVAKLSASNFLFDIVTFHGHPNPMKLPNDPSFGLSFSNDPVVKHTFVTNIAKEVSHSVPLLLPQIFPQQTLWGAHP